MDKWFLRPGQNLLYGKQRFSKVTRSAGLRAKNCSLFVSESSKRVRTIFVNRFHDTIIVVDPTCSVSVFILNFISFIRQYKYIICVPPKILRHLRHILMAINLIRHLIKPFQSFVMPSHKPTRRRAIKLTICLITFISFQVLKTGIRIVQLSLIIISC